VFRAAISNILIPEIASVERKLICRVLNWLIWIEVSPSIW
jgi:hypothetical protein